MSLNMNSCILCLLSPVLRTMVCGNFIESIQKEIRLDDVEEETLLKLVPLACGKEEIVADDLEELFEMGELAERLQMEAVRAVVEDELSNALKVDNCFEMIRRSERSGLELFQRDCYKILQLHFDVVSQKEGFLKLSEETIGNLLEDDALWVDREDEVFEALAKWLRGNEKEKLREGLLRKIRYGVMSGEYLMRLTLLPGHGVLKELVGETMAKVEGRSDDGMWDGVERLCDKWKVARVKARIIGANVLKNPGYVAVDREGRMVVSDTVLHQVIVFNRDGSVARRIGSYGTVPGQFNKPSGVAVDRQGHIIVADHRNHRIQVLNANGTVVRCFGSEGSEAGQLDRPCGVVIDREGHIVVTDDGDRIQVFDQNGTYVRHFGSYGAAVGELRCPTGVAVDGVGRIVVADQYNYRVQVFNGDGSVALCFGTEGDGPGQLNNPCGVAVDSAGRFVVADWGNDRVQVFNSDGSLAREMGSANPVGVAIDGAGRIVVAEGWCHGTGSDFNHPRVQIHPFGIDFSTRDPGSHGKSVQIVGISPWDPRSLMEKSIARGCIVSGLSGERCDCAVISCNSTVSMGVDTIGWGVRWNASWV